eukprot:2288597-Rhodomonas_salina.2
MVRVGRSDHTLGQYRTSRSKRAGRERTRTVDIISVTCRSSCSKVPNESESSPDRDSAKSGTGQR